MLRYKLQMIAGFRHKGLERFYSSGNTSGINAQHAPKLLRQLTALNASKEPAGMNMPGWKLHPLQGQRKGEWAVSVSGNWRLVFSFEGSNAVGVDYEDYH